VRTSGREIVAVCCDNVTQHVGFVGQNMGIFEADGTCNDHRRLKQWCLNCDDFQGIRKQFLCILRSQSVI
jgi:hypothetical protein